MKKRVHVLWDILWVNTLRPKQNGRHFEDDIFKCIFLNENIWIRMKISLKFVPKGRINNIPALVQILAWLCRSGDKPLSKLIMVSLPTHICVSWPQWVKAGITKPRSLIQSLRIFSILQKCVLDYSNHVHIGQVSPQLRCKDTYQIQTPNMINNQCFDHSEKKRYNSGTMEVGLVTPTPGCIKYIGWYIMSIKTSCLGTYVLTQLE